MRFSESLILDGSTEEFSQGRVVLLIRGNHGARQVVMVQRPFNLREVYARFRWAAEAEAVLLRENMADLAGSMGMIHGASAIRADVLRLEPGEVFLEYLFSEGYVAGIDAMEMHIHSDAYAHGITVYETVE